jgi:hypothetical protein
MRFHASVVEDILRTCQNFGGHANEKKLRENLFAKRYATYSGDRQDVVIVDAQRLLAEMAQRRLSTATVVPMALHKTTFEKIVYLHELYSGYDSEKRLREALTRMELTPYEIKTGPDAGVTVLVLTEDYVKSLRQNSAPFHV